MNDLISRQSIKKKLQEQHDFFIKAYGGFNNLPANDKSRVDEITNCIAMVVNEPSVQPEQKVVRCKDCKHYVPWDYDHYSYCVKSHLQHPVENCFCSYAETKMEEGDANAE